MRILLDCRPLQKSWWGGEGNPGLGGNENTGPEAERARLIFSAAADLSAMKETEWVFVVTRDYKGKFPLQGKVVFRRGLPGRAGYNWWYDRQIPRLARKEGVDLVWLTGGIAAGDCGVPQWLWMPERMGAKAGKGSRLKPGLERAAAVFCFSDRDRGWLADYLPGVEGKTQVLAAFPEEGYGPLSLTEREKIKSEWTQGKEYFLADLTGGGEAGVVDLLKSFSLFKKRQRSQMRLVLTGEIPVAGGIRERLSTYKYRQDIDWPEKPDAAGLRALTGAAYAVLFAFEQNGLGTRLLNAWKAGVPAIVPGGGLMEEMAQGAALGQAMGDPVSLAAQLMKIYKEEELRKELIGKGFERLNGYSRERFREVLRGLGTY
jgi:hypothetical protein